MAFLQVEGFAGLKLNGNGHTVDHFPTHHVEELLGYLLLNQDKSICRDQLIELLWPCDEPKNCRDCLNTVLWRLRCIFRGMGFSAKSLIVSAGDWIIFSPQMPFEFDVGLFTRHIREAMDTQNDAARMVELSKAVRLYKGDLYEGIFSDWCIVERERLARFYLQALGELMYCQIGRREYAEAISLGQTILNFDPLREEVHRALIFCYGRLGRRSEAWSQFQSCAQYLMNEVQVLPMADTVRIIQQVMIAREHNYMDAPNIELHRTAHQTFAQFMKTGNQLHEILEEIENSQALILN